MVRILLTTDPAADLRNAGERNTDAACAEFARAWSNAAHIFARAAGIEVEVDTSGDAMRADDWRRRNAAAGLDAERVRDVWQAVHDSVHSTRPGRWGARRASARKYGAALASQPTRRT